MTLNSCSLPWYESPSYERTHLLYIYIFVLFYYMSYFRNNSNRIASRLRCITIILIQWVVSLGRDPAETVMKSSYRAQSRSKCKDGSRLRGVVLPCEFLSFFLEGHSTHNGYFDLFFHSVPPFSRLFYLSFFLSSLLLTLPVSPSKVRPHTPPHLSPTIKYHSYNPTQHFFKKEFEGEGSTVYGEKLAQISLY